EQRGRRVFGNGLYLYGVRLVDMSLWNGGRDDRRWERKSVIADERDGWCVIAGSDVTGAGGDVRGHSGLGQEIDQQRAGRYQLMTSFIVESGVRGDRLCVHGREA